MKNIFRFLAEAKGAVAVIVALLIIQAYCDLSLPSYTSDLLNVGLQQNGISDAVPETIRAESLETLELFLSDEDAEKVEAAYSESSDPEADEGTGQAGKQEADASAADRNEGETDVADSGAGKNVGGQDAADPDEDEVRSLKKLTSAERRELNDLLALPESVVFQMGNSEEGAAMLAMAKGAVRLGVMSSCM